MNRFIIVSEQATQYYKMDSKVITDLLKLSNAELTDIIQSVYSSNSFNAAAKGVNPTPSRKAVGKRGFQYYANSVVNPTGDYPLFGPSPAAAAPFADNSNPYFYGFIDYTIYLSLNASVGADSAVLKGYVGDGVNTPTRCFVVSCIWSAADTNKVLINGSTVAPVTMQAIVASQVIAGTEVVGFDVNMRGILIDWR